jgi:hypothetical protein
MIGLCQNDGALTTPSPQPILHKFPKEKTFHLTEKFQVFANVYCVDSTRKGEKTF